MWEHNFVDYCLCFNSGWSAIVWIYANCMVSLRKTNHTKLTLRWSATMAKSLIFWSFLLASVAMFEHMAGGKSLSEVHDLRAIAARSLQTLSDLKKIFSVADVKSSASRLSCLGCEVGVAGIQELLKLGVSRDLISANAMLICEIFHVESTDVCHGIVNVAKVRLIFLIFDELNSYIARILLFWIPYPEFLNLYYYSKVYR